MSEVLLLILAIAFFARRGRGVGRVRDGLPTLLEGAASAGIITAAQREQLLAYAAEHQPGGRLGGAAWLGVFAGLFVVAGVALLIARNWDDIGPLLRIGGFVLTLTVVGEAAVEPARTAGPAFRSSSCGYSSRSSASVSTCRRSSSPAIRSARSWSGSRSRHRSRG
jgi:hypothetical protein